MKGGDFTDFYKIGFSYSRNGMDVLFKPEYYIRPSKDLMIRGGAFYAIWDAQNRLWSTDEMDLCRIIDDDINKEMASYKQLPSMTYKIKGLYMSEYKSKSWLEWKAYLRTVPDNFQQLDSKICFANTVVSKEDYCSRKLPYNLEPGDYSAWDKLISVLYDPEEREKIEWAIGSIVSGDSVNIQKFYVFYGDAGTGKSTILNIIWDMFEPYATSFNAKDLASRSNGFSMEPFRNNPLVAIQHDGDLSIIEDNTKINSIVSHEWMEINEKFKSSYTVRLNATLFMGTNRPVKITDSKSGIIRRLIDITPSGRLISSTEYNILKNRIKFEHGAIAAHCLEVYNTLGRHYYDNYKPFEMISSTDVFFNFVSDNQLIFKNQEYTQLRQAWELYRQYCEDTMLPIRMPMYKFRVELKNYFDSFREYITVDGHLIRSVYLGFRDDKLAANDPKNQKQAEAAVSLTLESTVSLLDELLKDCPAQYATENGTPMQKWENVKTKLSDLDTKKVHYVQYQSKFPNLIVIDFDLKNDKGEKDAELNLKEASKWPPTYAEFSKGGAGIHLCYFYDGDVNQLSRIYKEDVEIKVLTGSSALRRRLSFCNNLPVATISGGLPLREAKKVIDYGIVKSERTIREMIEKNLAKEYHSNTTQSISFIYKILEDAYNSGIHYDVTDLRPRVLAFANNSTHQASNCVKMVAKMHFKSDEDRENTEASEDAPIVFFDVEVFPNLFLINWKYPGEDKVCVRMINPTPQEVGELFRFKLIGFNNRRYDNHILYARYLGYDNHRLFMLSQRLINDSKNAMFGEAYNISYTDIYDFASNVNKKSLKKFEIELHIHHKELGLPWDEDVPEEKWEMVAEYCDNDVLATEKVFYHLKSDWIARQILAKLSGLTVNDTTNQHSTRIIFGKNKKPQGEFLYRNLAEPVKDLDPEVRKFLIENTAMTQLPFSKESILPYFPGYTFERGKSLYKGYEVGEGGFVHAKPGMYYNVALLDIASMHPSSIEDECLFGPIYTKKFSDIKSARVHIKHKDRAILETMFDGALKEFLKMIDDGEITYKDLSTALKTVINSVYGLTSASFDHPFRDRRNVDNIVAKRGALFMIDLLEEVTKRGWTAIHIKTDSIKIANATPEIIQFVMDFGLKYGYVFEHEATYERICLINDAVYIAKYANGEHAGEWTPTGARFAHPYIFKTLFSKEPLDFYDYCETKSVSAGYIYLDMNETLPDVSLLEKERDKAVKKGLDQNVIDDYNARIADGHNYIFVGKVGSFVPVMPGHNGGVLVSYSKGKYNSISGAKGYRWVEAEVAEATNKTEYIDMSYFRALVDDALDQMRKFGDVEAFLNGEVIEDVPPWCTKEDCATCENHDSCSSLAATYVR